ncbi:N-acetylmuramoyl-L-alanine amidase [Clostridium botulinum]|uniref:N-acetylmuramoyl-L-alanine amidase n=1 Tax=Clostridium botulinum TaxID=1491 RepID=UPI0004D5644A|nr:N-acetylmuramoyl-L-alanine amidase [Clostridium botulinum]KEI03072.1 N-acetylmuramoyl-L-alanine amidase [Clostridium botulinum C/D str. BKT75002]KEI13488.1 N-acetylmuramoyl-L-alanine amidase [Clostridium botulinum C/D str. BKT2873]KGM94968.1 N-acetylmuramoyl-L-alanine amidase [Clostridium botulinum D str. CCUG 7971]KOC49301.1 N-acetylmuramoyl-L-alanine amidase [Clostridium botulinum]MCD3351807.1 N-acetylmuramoyl-L-alanine amidase [Clostridium botulinum D/C]
MVNKRKILLLFLCILSITLGIPNKVFAGTYKDMGKKSNVVLDKVWDIKFNKDIDATTINKKNIVVVDDKNNNVSIDVKYKNSRQVIVSTINNYKPSSNYTMFINEDIKSTDGKRIKTPAKMEFLTEKNYIKNVNDITEIVSQGRGYSFPTNVEATMSDGTVSKVPVKWNRAVADTSKSGTYSFEGKIEGYPRIIALTLIVNPRVIPQKDFKVVIDPAGGANIRSSSVGPTGINEKDVNLAIALKLGNLLKSKGIGVAYTRTEDKVSWNENEDDSARIKIANDSKADLFVSINSNSYTVPASHGIETYYYKDDSLGKELAENVQRSIISSIGGTDRGSKERDFGLLKGIDKPGIIVYPGFITNQSEEKLLNDSVYQDKIAKSIADNIEKHMSNLNTKIKSVNNININVYQGDKCNLPSKISAVNTDNKDIQVPVTWDRSSIDTSKVGTISVKGKIKGYDKSVILTIAVSSIPAKKIKVAIDPGHGGYDSGAVGPNGICEKNVALAVALKLGKVLEQKGIEVVYTRTSDKCPWPSNKNTELQMRCDIANNAKADYFVSIHCNSADTSAATGIETYYDRNRTNGIELARNIQNELIKQFGYKNRGIKPCGFYVVKNTNMPAVLVELEFISNGNREQVLNNSTYQQRYADSIAKGIMNTIGK